MKSAASSSTNRVYFDLSPSYGNEGIDSDSVPDLVDDEDTDDSMLDLEFAGLSVSAEPGTTSIAERGSRRIVREIYMYLNAPCSYGGYHTCWSTFDELVGRPGEEYYPGCASCNCVGASDFHHCRDACKTSAGSKSA